MKLKKKDLKQIHADTKNQMLEIADHYGLDEDGIEQRLWDKAKLILEAPSLDLAVEQSHKTIDSMKLFCLYLWGQKKIPGPSTPENFEKKANAAEKLADFQAHLGNMEASKKQRDRAVELRKKAMELRGMAA